MVWLMGFKKQNYNRAFGQNGQLLMIAEVRQSYTKPIFVWIDVKNSLKSFLFCWPYVIQQVGWLFQLMVDGC